MAFSRTLKEKKLVVQCDSCFREVTLDPFTKCTECDWDQCLPCFFQGLETSVHKKWHSFRVVSDMTKTLMYTGWRVIDELLVLHGVISFGIGNFEDIASIVPNKTQAEVKEHFFTLFEVINNEMGEKPRSTVPKSDPNDKHVLSYMPKRGDFESEILNDYEQVISSLQFSSSDAAFEKQLKKHMLYYYSAIMLQRRIWKSYVLDRNLVAVSIIKEKEHGKVGDLISGYKWLLQYLSKKDFNLFIARLLRENQLRDLIGSRKNPDSQIDLAKLKDVSGLLGDNEKHFCERLGVSLPLYAQLKSFAIECLMAKKPLLSALETIFGSQEKRRVEILYHWFMKQKIVYCGS